MAARALPLYYFWLFPIQTFRFTFKFTLILKLFWLFLIGFKHSFSWFWCDPGFGCWLIVAIPLSYGNLRLLLHKSCLIIFFFFISEYFTLANYLLLVIIVEGSSFYMTKIGKATLYRLADGNLFPFGFLWP